MVDIENTIRAPKSFPEIWQPIASAPRDGTFVLTKAGSWQPCITHFATYDGQTRWGSSPEGFMTEEEFLRYWHEVTYDPTEWMPLPMDDVTDSIETAYRNGFEDGERHAGEAALLAQSLADTYKSQLDALTARLKAAKAPPETNMATRLVIVESPFAGDVEANITYARAALRDCLDRGEAPYASHLLYTQPGVLDDNDADQRRQGIEAGLAWGKIATATIVYTDRGISAGMQLGIDRAKAEGRAVEYRSIEKAAVE